jgi:Protein of unknown function (DUF3108)
LFKRLRLPALLVAAALLLLTRGDWVQADPTGETPAALVPPDLKIPRKQKLPKHQAIKLPLSAGEKLTYSIKWGAVDAGQAVLTVKRREQYGPGGPQVWNVHCKTRSNAFVSIFYVVRDDIQTLIDVESGHSHKFKMQKNEGNIHATENIQFDYEAREAKYARTQRDMVSDKIRSKVIRLPGRVHDPLSCLYYVRGMDLKVGEKRQLTINTSKKNWLMTINVLREEQQEISGLGKVTCLVVEPVAQFQGIFVRKGKMTVWLEKTTKIPLMMKVNIPVGSVSVILTKAENSALSDLVSGKAPARVKTGKK